MTDDDLKSGIAQIRKRWRIAKQKRMFQIGDVVECDGRVGVCVEMAKGYADFETTALDEYGNPVWFTLIYDEQRRGPEPRTYVFRDDL